MHPEVYLLTSVLVLSHIVSALPVVPISSNNVKRQDSVGSIANSFGSGIAIGDGVGISPDIDSALSSLKQSPGLGNGIDGGDVADKKLKSKRQGSASLLQQMQQQVEASAENSEIQLEAQTDAQTVESSNDLASKGVSKSKSKRQDIASALQSLQQANSAAAQNQMMAAQSEALAQDSQTSEGDLGSLSRRNAAAGRLVSRQDGGDIDSETAQYMQAQSQMFQSEMQAQNQMQQQTTEEEFAQKMNDDGSGSGGIQK